MKKPHPLFVLCLLFTFWVLMHTFSTPVFEAPDEIWHYAYVRWLAEGHGLPSLVNDQSGANQEVAQPPLYYGVAALFSAPFPDDDLETLLWGNPGFGYQGPLTSRDNKNMLIHTKDEGWPWHGAALSVHVTRLVSLLFGLVTVAATWGLGYETFQSRRGALLTAALLAFHPQFVFICSIVNNDSAAAALATLSLWVIAHMLRQGVTVKRAAIAGICIGLASLTKTSALALIPVYGLAVFMALISHRARFAQRQTLIAIAIFVGVILLVGGWWYGRNTLLYGDPLGISQHTDTLWGRPETVSLLALLPEIPLLLRSFWAAYGWGHVMWADWIYLVLWGMAGFFLIKGIVGVLRIGYWVLRGEMKLETKPAILLTATAWLGIIIAALLQWMRQVSAPHGRLLFPALGAWALLIATGIHGTQRETNKHRKIPVTVFLGLLATLSTLAPGARILRTFAPPRLQMASTATQTTAHPVDLRYTDSVTKQEQIRLLGYTVDTMRVHPGETITVRACWEGLRAMTYDYTVFVHLLGPQNQRVGERHTYPGLGRFPTTQWPVGRAFCEPYRLTVEPWADGPIRYQLEIGLFDSNTGTRLQSRTPDGTPIEPPIVGAVTVLSKTPSPAPETAVSASFDDTVALVGYDVSGEAAAGEIITLALHWEATQTPDADLTAFIHLWDPSQDTAPLAQHDGPPCDGWFPTTAWQTGDYVVDSHPLHLPSDLAPGHYPLWAGLYRAVDGTRLPVVDSGGQRYPHDLVSLGILEVQR